MPVPTKIRLLVSSHSITPSVLSSESALRSIVEVPIVAPARVKSLATYASAIVSPFQVTPLNVSSKLIVIVSMPESTVVILVPPAIVRVSPSVIDCPPPLSPATVKEVNPPVPDGTSQLKVGFPPFQLNRKNSVSSLLAPVSVVNESVKLE